MKRDFKQGRLLWDFDCSSETRLFVAVIENKILSRDLNNTSPFSMVKDLETISTSFLFVKSFRHEVTVSMEANNSSAFFSWMLLWEDFFGDLFYGSWKHRLQTSYTHNACTVSLTLARATISLHPKSENYKHVHGPIFPNVPSWSYWKQLLSGGINGENRLMYVLVVRIFRMYWCTSQNYF